MQAYGETIEDIYDGMAEDILANFGKKADKEFRSGFHDAWSGEGLTPFWTSRP